MPHRQLRLNNESGVDVEDEDEQYSTPLAFLTIGRSAEAVPGFEGSSSSDSGSKGEIRAAWFYFSSDIYSVVPFLWGLQSQNRSLAAI